MEDELEENQDEQLFVSEEDQALDQVQELLDVVGKYVDDQQQQQQQQQPDDDDITTGHTSDVVANNKNSTKKQDRLGGIHAALIKLRKQQLRLRKRGKRFEEKIKAHPVILKTTAATRKAITGSEDQRVRDYVVMPKVIRVVDTYTFTLGVLGIMVTEYIMLEHPSWFKYYYMAVMGPLIGLRHVLYTRSKAQYYLFDFCYWVHGLAFALILFPTYLEEIWWHALFVCANGPVLLASVFWNNSMVFHSVDKVTSTYLHLFPAILTWCRRLGEESAGTQQTTAVVVDGADYYRGQLLLPLEFYLIWQVTYLLQTEVIDKDIIDQDPEISTSLRYMTAASKSGVNKAALRISRKLGIMSPTETFVPVTIKVKLIFVVYQFIYTLILFSVTSLVYSFQTLHLGVLLFVITTSIYNGARYYVQVFSKAEQTRYFDESEK